MKSKSTKKPRTTKPAPKAKASTRLLKLIIAALDDKKAEDLRVLDVSKQSSITDYLVLATANSEPHLRALRIELERVLEEGNARVVGVDTTKGSGWTVVDTFEIMIHLFTPENREKYRLELLWRDAAELPVGSLLR
jgi:ribosome-associated protein